MLVYLLLIAFISILFLSDPKKNRSVFIFILIATLVCGLRDMIGGYDIYIYSEVFEKKTYNFSFFEKGFLFYFRLLGLISTDRHFMLLVTACLTWIPLYFFFKKWSVAMAFSIFIFFCKFYLMSFVYIRQGLAIVILCASIPYILKRDFIKFIILFIIAFFFHKSALIFLPMYFLVNIKIKNTTLIFLIFIIIILSFIPLGNVFEVLITFDIMIDETIEAHMIADSGFNILYLIEILLIYAVLSVDRISGDKTHNLIRNGVMMYIMATTLGLRNATFIRLNWYFLCFLALYVPLIYQHYKNAKILYMSNIIKTVTYVYFALLFIRMVFIWDGGDLIPYKSILDNTTRHGMWEYREYR